MLISEIRDKVRKNVDPKRFEHILGVAETARMLGCIHGADGDTCELAGLLHDCAKCFTDEELLRLCSSHGIVLSEELKASPQLIHAVYGPTEARETYGITDQKILDAVRFHTTGKPDMSLLEMIIFISDYIEPHRTKAKNLTDLRKLSVTAPKKCTAMILRDTIDYLSQKKTPIDTDTIEAFAFYKEYL